MIYYGKSIHAKSIKQFERTLNWFLHTWMKDGNFIAYLIMVILSWHALLLVKRKKLLLKCVKIPSTKLKWSFYPREEPYISLGHLHTTNTSTKIELVYRNFMELKTYRITIVQCTLEGSIVLLKMYFAYLERIMAF